MFRIGLVREPFTRYTEEEEYDKADIVNVRLNREERFMLEALKMSHKEKNDSTALKKEAFRVLKQLTNFERIKNK